MKSLLSWLSAFAAGVAVTGYLLKARKKTSGIRDAAEARNEVNRMDTDDAVRRELRAKGWYRGD